MLFCASGCGLYLKDFSIANYEVQTFVILMFLENTSGFF